MQVETHISPMRGETHISPWLCLVSAFGGAAATATLLLIMADALRQF
jgi:hypothetical protein